MKKQIFSLAVGLIIAASSCTNGIYAQEISKSKSISINNIKASGYDIKFFPIENRFAYIRYDNFGSALVSYEYTENTVRRVTFLCSNPKMAIERFRDILANVPLAELGKPQREHGIWDRNNGRMYTSSSIYYKADAIYSTELNQEERSASLIIDIL